MQPHTQQRKHSVHFPRPSFVLNFRGAKTEGGQVGAVGEQISHPVCKYPHTLTHSHSAKALSRGYS